MTKKIGLFLCMIYYIKGDYVLESYKAELQGKNYRLLNAAFNKMIEDCKKTPAGNYLNRVNKIFENPSMEISQYKNFILDWTNNFDFYVFYNVGKNEASKVNQGSEKKEADKNVNKYQKLKVINIIKLLKYEFTLFYVKAEQKAAKEKSHHNMDSSLSKLIHSLENVFVEFKTENILNEKTDKYFCLDSGKLIYYYVGLHKLLKSFANNKAKSIFTDIENLAIKHLNTRILHEIYVQLQKRCVFYLEEEREVNEKLDSLVNFKIVGYVIKNELFLYEIVDCNDSQYLVQTFKINYLKTKKDINSPYLDVSQNNTTINNIYIKYIECDMDMAEIISYFENRLIK